MRGSGPAAASGVCRVCGHPAGPAGLGADGVPEGWADAAGSLCTRCACDFCCRPAGLVMGSGPRRMQVCGACVGAALAEFAAEPSGLAVVRLDTFRPAGACGAGRADHRGASGRARGAGQSNQEVSARAGQQPEAVEQRRPRGS